MEPAAPETRNGPRARRSRGGRLSAAPVVTGIGALACALVLSAAAAQTPSGTLPGGGEDTVSLLARWLDEAEDGSAEAKLGLGTLYDLGLGVESDAARAFRWYAEAAEEGLAQAQFNVALMLDEGRGASRDRRAAAGWYARAALRGDARAALNLGILFEMGDGVDRNLALARAWLTESARGLDRAGERLDALPAPGDGPPAAPAPLVSAVRDGRAELAWTAPGGAADGRFLVEVVARDASGGFAPVTETSTGLSAALVEVPEGIPLLWRVSALGRDDYAASPWQTLGEGDGEAARIERGGPIGRVRFELPSDDIAALVLAAELSASFRLAGLMVVPAGLGASPTRARVSYAYASDAALAARIAAALPGSVVPERDDGAAAGAPGLVRVALAGGPAAN